MKLFCKAARICAGVLLCCVLLFSGCAETPPTAQDDLVRVTLIKSDDFEIADGGASGMVIHSGQDATFFVRAHEGYSVSGTDYDGSEIVCRGNGITEVFLPTVKYNLRVRVFCEKTPNADPPIDPSGGGQGTDPSDGPSHDGENRNVIRYDANGGEYFDPDASYEAEIVLNGHLRPNTEIGTDKIYRKGYTLLCWNTEPDGGGVSYGLGSRCDLPEKGQLRLYAQWAKWDPAEDFALSEIDGEYWITGYNGKNRIVCIPELIGGIFVTRISEGAFFGKELQSVILPKSMERVEDGAFRASTVEDLWFFDNLTYISDASFLLAAHMPTLHINAVLAPRYSKLDRHSNYADKVDILKSHEHEKKIVLFGGSGAFFSVDSSMIYEAFGGEYEVVNMAINAWFPATAQTDIILHYLHEGDIFLHLPEMASPAQLFAVNSFALPNYEGYDDRYMMCFESNYDLLSLVDPNDSTGILDSFTRYNAERRTKKEVSYSDNPDFIDEYGDYKGDKPRNRYDYELNGEAGIRSDYLTEESLARLDFLYLQIKERGAQPYLGYAAVNLSALEVSDQTRGTHYLDAEAEKYQTVLKENIKNAPIIESLEQAYYTGSWFFDTDWHLSDEGAAMNTEVLIACLKKYEHKE